jgi:hypothetical protein
MNSSLTRSVDTRSADATSELQNSGISGWMKYQAKGARSSVPARSLDRSAVLADGKSGRGHLRATDRSAPGTGLRLLARGDSDALKTSTVALSMTFHHRRLAGLGRPGLDFTLRPEEAYYLRRKWRTAGEAGTRPLLAG